MWFSYNGNGDELEEKAERVGAKKLRWISTKRESIQEGAEGGDCKEEKGTNKRVEET